ncbi:uncharacterized protein [Temnothorax longispinosus]|uniref:uncharacterized protein isoform X2 n=1 Tax=Temnothorax longispinosus TaxID=300112 RepID=UPI003A9A39CE
MAQPTDKRTIFVCDNCDAVLEGSAAAKTHYYNCTMRDSETQGETEGLHASSQSSPEIPENDQKELLITEVFCREPLWNTLLPYSERHYKTTSALWNEVDVILGVQDGYSQKTFKTLRDRFVRLLGEESKSKRSGSAASNTVEWKYFSQLEFLRPSVEYRPVL